MHTLKHLKYWLLAIVYSLGTRAWYHLADDPNCPRCRAAFKRSAEVD